MPLFDDTRADWGAAPRASWLNQSRFDAPIRSRIGRTWHYDGGTPLVFTSHKGCLAKVKADQRLHMGPGREWGDIGYNALVCGHGRAIEGRDLNTAGAHCPGLNHTHVGIQLMVGGDQRPTAAQYARATRLASDLEHAAGHSLTDNVHSDGYGTECPGVHVKAWERDGGPSGRAGGAYGSGGGSTTSPVTGGGIAHQEVDIMATLSTDEAVAKIADGVADEPVAVGYGRDGNMRASAHWSKSSFHANGAHQEIKRARVDLAGVSSTLDTVLGLLKAQSSGADLPSKDEILAQVRAAADERMKQLDFTDSEDPS